MKKHIFLLALWLPVAAMGQRSISSERIEVTACLDGRARAEMEQLLSPYKAKVDSVMAPVLGESLVGMSAGRPESLLGNWAADVLVEHSDIDGRGRADLGLANVGGLRANMPKGTVRRGDILQISPFQNVLSVVTLRGTDLLELFRNIAAVGGEAVSREVRLTITSDGQLKDALLNGQPIDPERLYRIATLDYLAEGNDRMHALKRAVDRVDTQFFTRDLMMQSIQKAGTITAEIEGRITTPPQPSTLTPALSLKGEGAEKSLSASQSTPQTPASTSMVYRQPTSSSNTNYYAPSPAGEGRGGVRVLHTSDTHSCVEPLSLNDPNPDQAGKAGYVRRSALIDSLRRQTPDLLLFDCGDYSQGSPYYNLFRGEVEVRLMNAMQYDAATIGNHEFDFGLENMARLFRMAEFPIVCCNYDFTGTPCEGLVRPYVILRRDGLRIGVFGVAPQPAGLIAKANYEGMTYTAPAEAAQPVIDRLRQEEHCDAVICLSHLGYGDEPEQDIAFIRQTRGIDLVLGGHTHTYWEHARYLPNADGRLIPLDHQGKNARFVGQVEMEW